MAVTINIPSQVKTYANLAAFPASGSLKTIYIAEDTNKTYRWDSSTYVEISASAATGLTVGTTPIASGTNGRVLFQGTGNVLQQSAGLTYDNASGRIQVYNSANPSFRLLTDFSNLTKYSFFQTISSTPIEIGFIGNQFGTGMTLQSFNSLYFNAANVERMRIVSGTGNVLINTTTDAGFKLDVNGTARVKGTGTTFATTSFSVINNANTPSLTILDNASVYFGGEIFGPSNFYINGPTNGTGTIHLRPAILNLSTATVQYNGTQFLGTGSGADLRIGSVAVGYNSLSMYVSGAERMRISSGGNLLINTTTDAGFRLDVNGTARVQDELTVNTIPISLGAGAISTNIKIGNSSLSSNTTGSRNIAIGQLSLQSNTTASSNIAIGVQCLTSNNGSNNIAVGYLTMLSNTSGFSNVAIGQQSMRLNTTGNENVAINQEALKNNTTGSANIAIGRSALLNNTTGSNNISLGYISANLISSGSNCNIANNSIFIGRDTRPNDDNQTNQIVIGHQAIGAGSNTVTLGNTSITKTILRGTINAANLPTSATGLSSGDVWNDGGTLKIV